MAVEATLAPQLRGIHYLNLKNINNNYKKCSFFIHIGGKRRSAYVSRVKDESVCSTLPKLKNNNLRDTAGKLLKLRHTASSAAVTSLAKVEKKEKKRKTNKKKMTRKP